MSRFERWLSVFVFLALFSPSDVAAQAPLEKIRLAYSAIGGSQASFWIPYEAGIFRKHGLDVELLYVAGGGRAGQVVQSGEVPIGVFTGGAVINANLAGGDLAVVASSMNVMTFSVMARPEIKRPEDLKGKKIGVSRFGSATDFGLRYVEEKWPIKRQRDFAVIQVGGVTDVYNALRAGALDAAVVNAELAILARRDGFRELVDIAKMGINFPTSSAVTTRSFIKRNENAVRKFVGDSSRACISPRPSAGQRSRSCRSTSAAAMRPCSTSCTRCISCAISRAFRVRRLNRSRRFLTKWWRLTRASPISNPNNLSTRVFFRNSTRKALSRNCGNERTER